MSININVNKYTLIYVHTYINTHIDKHRNTDFSMYEN